MRYEEINFDNIELAFNIQKHIWPKDPDYESFYDKVINKSDDNISWLVYIDDNIIGITGIYTEEIDKDSIWLEWFTILPKYRRKGYGEKVLLDTINYCKNLNRYKYFRLHTTYYKDRPALFLYDKIMDFKEKYTVEDTIDVENNYLIYTYILTGKKKFWANRYLGINE